MFFTILIAMATGISNFQSTYLLQLFQPRNHIDQKKNCALGVLRYGLGPKQPRLAILPTSITRLGTQICPNAFIKIYNHIWFIKKNQFDQV